MKKDIKNITEFISKNEGSAFLFTPPIFNDAKSFLAKKPKYIITSNSEKEFIYLLEQMDYFKKDYFLVSLINYEAGYFIEEKFNSKFSLGDYPIASLLVYDYKDVLEINSKELTFHEAEKSLVNLKKLISNLKLNVTKKDYIHNIHNIKNEIEEGNTYQVNYTLRAFFEQVCKPDELFLSLIFSQSAEFSAMINFIDKFFISNSPELFFKKKGNVITAKPMKGTVGRGKNSQEDKNNAKWLLESEKDRAENTMILDLLRNDLGRISKYNTVKAELKYNIEKYESLFQMTSDVISDLKTDSLLEIFKNIYPSGSITGAPKISTINIISKIEKSERGIYTGSVGFVNKDEAIFNVAIRTPVINKNDKRGVIGIGSGIVWDSKPELEYNEVLLKAKYLTEQFQYFELFETMLVEKSRVKDLSSHILRIKLAAEYFLFLFDENQIRNKLEHFIVKQEEENYVVKMTLSKWGNLTFQKRDIPHKKMDLRVKISEKRTDSNNKFLFFKTTNRKLYDSERSNALNKNYDEIIFINENGELTEGAISNIFVKINNQYFTPEINCGLLNGCERDKVIKNYNVIERKILIKELYNTQEMFLTNSIRGKVNIKNITFDNGETIEF